RSCSPRRRTCRCVLAWPSEASPLRRCQRCLQRAARRRVRRCPCGLHCRMRTPCAKGPRASTCHGNRGGSTMEPEPRLAFVHADAVPGTGVVAQLHGVRRVSVHEKFLEWNAKRMVVLGRYDPHVVIERHGHASDHLVYVLEGELLVGDRRCGPGTLIVLELGAKFGP